MTASLKGTQADREGYDFFFNRATGKNESCSEKCDIPSLYETTCKLVCKFYTPKERATIQSTSSIQDYIQDNQYPFYIILAVLATVLLIIVLGCCYRNKLKELIARFRERLCERLTQAQTETGHISKNSSRQQNNTTAGTGQAGYKRVGQSNPVTVTINEQA